ncbi:MAG TPA: glycosyltransferase family 39 protein [Ktedonobacterales bacterium]|nr:glycosyltransferase family 39 protein [Ktedonobacterales bacterium]
MSDEQRAASGQGTTTLAAPDTTARPFTAAQRRRDYVILLGLGLLARGITAALFDQPGYIDAAYYYDVAKNIATGHGFTEDFILTYLTPAANVVHPSNLYWMPLASLIIVPFFLIFGVSWHVAQIPSVLLSGALPLLAYWLGWDWFHSRRYALGAALLTLCAGFYYPLYFVFSDNFGIYAWTAGLALIFLGQGMKGRAWRFALAGLWIGLAHLSRADAPLLLVIALVGFGSTRYRAWRARGQITEQTDGPPADARPTALPWISLLGLLAFYLLVMSPWFARNLIVAGAILPPGGTQTIWLTTYNDFFSYGKDISLQNYLAWGWGNILLSKLGALGQNGLAILAILEFASAPFAAIGLWRLRRAPQALPWLLYLILLYLGLSLVFTFPSQRGTLLHSFIPLLPFLSLATIYGLDTVINWLARRRPSPFAQERAAGRRRVYLAATIALSAVLSIVIIASNAQTWDNTYHVYQQVGTIVARDFSSAASTADKTNGQGASASALPVMMVSDPPDYYLATGQHAIALPDQDIPVMLQAADRYHATYLLLETLHSRAQDALWGGTEHSPRLVLLWSTPAAHLYRIIRAT